MFERRSLKWPILLAVMMIVLLVGLTVGWVLLNVFGVSGSKPSQAVYWVLLSVGSAMFVCVVVGVVLYLVLSIQQINLNRRQSNFIDSVTHELKSPIASLKLYLQTLSRRSIPEEKRQDFYQSMLSDVERLDRLISQLLDTARLNHHQTLPEEPTQIRLDEVLRELTIEILDRYELPEEAITLDLEPCELLVRRGDLNIIFRNLLDNAAKYSGTPANIAIRLKRANKRGWSQLSICNNGSGIPKNMRRQIFRRFVRVGNELERVKPGTGLGLFLVRAALKQLRGKIALSEPPREGGTCFEVLIPNSKFVESGIS